MAYIAYEKSNLRSAILPVAEEDAAHYGLSEADLAQIVVVLRDPTRETPRAGDDGQTRELRINRWRVRFRPEFYADQNSHGVVVFIQRIEPWAVTEQERKARERAKVVRKLSMDLVVELVKKSVSGGVG